ncbi:MAG: translation elongation factor Ts [Candidatus Gottesmanbacteria bacterium]
MINVDQIKKLREQTGAGIADIKEALEEAKGDEKKALEILKKKGLDKAAKKASRETAAGVVESYIHANKESGAMVVLTCETDFVARNEEFQKLAHEIAMQVCAMNPKDTKELLSQPWIRDEKQTIADIIKSHIAKFGENIKIKEIRKFAIK